MAKSIKPALPHGVPSPTIRPPRKVNAPGKPAAPSLSGPVGGVDDGGGAQDFSSRLPGQPFTPRPVD